MIKLILIATLLIWGVSSQCQNFAPSVKHATALVSESDPQQSSMQPIFKYNLGAISFQLDSSYYYEFRTPTDSSLTQKTIYEYDPQTDILSAIEFIYLENDSKWTPVGKYESYKHKTDELDAYYTWDSLTNSWICQRKTERKYDTEGRQLFYSNYQLMDYAGNESGKRHEHIFDERGNEISIINSIWDSSQKKWRPTFKTEQVYDSLNNRTLRIESEWLIQPLNEWKEVGKNKIEYESNQSGQKEYSYTLLWDYATSQWKNSSKDYFKYNEIGLQVYHSIYNWSKKDNDWYLVSREERTYDEMKNKTSITSYTYNYDEKKWIPERKNEYAYDEFGNMTLYSYYQWNTLENNWDGLGKIESVFLSLGLLAEETSYNWSNELNAWERRAKIIQDSNDHGQIRLNMNWDRTTQQWLASTKHEQKYDENGYMLMYEVSYWDSVLSKWDINYKQVNEFQYDSQNNMTLRWFYNWDDNKSDIILAYVEKFFYKEIETNSTKNFDDNKIKIYPNPTTGILNIENATPDSQFWLSNLSGQSIISGRLENASIDITNLPLGIYFLIIENPSYSYIKRIIKK